MKIAVITGKFPARSETFVKEHILGLAKRDHKVNVISCGVGESISFSEVKEIDLIGVRRFNIPCFGKNRICNFIRILATTIRHLKMVQYWFPKYPLSRSEIFWSRSVWEKIQYINPDVIHIHLGIRAASLVRYKASRKAIVTWHGYDANCLPNKRGDNMYRELFQTSLQHTVGSAFMQKRLEYLGASSEKISKISMGIDLNYFAYKERLNIPFKPLRIISVGRLEEVKGHTFLIQAVIELLDKGEEIELRIIGDGSLKNQLSMQAAASQYSSAIQLLGAKKSSEVLTELYAANLFCLTGVAAVSGIESQGVVFAEAQATGLPVVGSSIGGVPDSLIAGKTGLLCPPGDVPAIKRAIRFFIKDREAISAFGRQGRAFVESKFSLGMMLDSFESVYQSINN